MGIFEIISAIVLIIACVFIVIVVLMKDTKTQMSQTISGTSSDSFYQKNAGRTKEAILNRATIVAAIIFFVLALAVNIINVYWSNNKASANTGSDSDSSSVVSDISDDSSDTSEDSTDSSDSSEDSSDSDDSSEDSSDSSEDSSSETDSDSESGADSGESNE